MNEAVKSGQSAVLDEGVTLPPVTAGSMLRSAREAAGLHVAALAVSIKIPVKKLEALEADRLDLLPDAVFVRALAASVCRALKVDPAPVLNMLPQTIAPRLSTADRVVNAPFHPPGQSAGLTVPAFFARPAVLAVAALLIGVVVLALFPAMQASAPSVVDIQPGAQVVSEPAPVPAAAEMAQVAPAQLVTQAPVAIGSLPVVEGAASPVPQVTLESAPAKVPQIAPAAAAKPDVAVAKPDSAVVRPNVVTFKARGPSWVEVTDVKGVVQVRRTMAAGEVLGASGDLPLTVVVGRVDAIDVEVRGSPFTLTTIARENVARFEVK